MNISDFTSACALARAYSYATDSGLFFSKSERVGILKSGSNIICTSLKNKHFLFYAQGHGANIEPAIPS